MPRGLRKFVPVVIAIALLFVALPHASAAANHPPGPPTSLTVDDDRSPLAVTDDPSFGWIPQDPDRNEIQRAYEIQVYDANDTSDKHRVLDSQEVSSSDESYVHVPLLRSKLHADHEYWWTVRTWDRAGKVGPFAPLSSFVVGLGDRDWHAAWIRRRGAEHQTFEDYSFFRKVVRVSASPVVQARVYASAGQQYELHVNGQLLAHGPSFSYPDEQYYEATDVTGAVNAGSNNAFAFLTHWSWPGKGRPQSVPALIAHITIDHADGTRQTIETDGSWTTAIAPWNDTDQRNNEGNNDFIEHIDERAMPLGWDTTMFNDTWEHAVEVGAHPVAPFTHLVASRTHLVMTHTDPVRITKNVADFGQIFAATPLVTVQAPSAGLLVTLVGGDQLDPNGRVSRTNGIQDTNMTWEFVTRSGTQELRPFGYLGFRYLEVDGAPATKIAIVARHAAMPDESASTFVTSNATLNAIWKLARHSALYDSQEQFLDTPTREKGPFLMDSFDVSQATMAAFDERTLTEQELRDFAQSQTRYWPDGRINAVYPNDIKRDIPDFTQSYVEWVWQTYMTNGDREELAALYPTVEKVSDYVAAAIDPKTNLVTNLPGGGEDYLYGLVDWPPQMRYGYDMTTVARTTQNVLAVDDFRRVADIARTLNRPASEARSQDERAERVTDAIRKRLMRGDGVLTDGLLPNGQPSRHASEQANAWGLAFGIVPARQVPAVSKYVVALKNQMGVPFFRVLLDALHASGHDDALIAALTDASRPGYAQILKRGATFTWESWDAPEVGDSESHGWGATVLAVLQQDVLGVRTTAPGSATLAVVPSVGLQTASGVVATQRGPVTVSWARDAAGKLLTVDVDIPVNVTANVVNPATGRAFKLGSGHYVLPGDAVTHNGGSSHTTIIVIVIVVLAAAAASALAFRRRRRAIATN